MRYLTSPEFNAKLTALGPSDIQRVVAFVQTIGTCDKAQLLSGKAHEIMLLGQDVYVSKLGPMRLYFTIGNDAEGDYVLLLDATTEHSQTLANELFATKNPRANSSLNPAVNTSINPKWNAGLNPKWNASINPKWNASINPKWNASINPKWNASLNPKWNASINPKWNASLNPRFNSSINPRMNPAFGGPYLYTTDLRQEGYVVRANDDVELVFDLAAGPLGELVRVNAEVRVQFGADNEWNGYLVRANDDVTLRYDVDGNWIGLVI